MNENGLKWKNDSNGRIVMATRSSLMRPIENIQNSIDNETVGIFIIACPHFLT